MTVLHYRICHVLASYCCCLATMLCASLVNSACHVYYCYCLVTVLCVGLVYSICHVATIITVW